MKIKICGIKSADEARLVLDASREFAQDFTRQNGTQARFGVDYLGMIFADSPRQVSVEMARAVADAAHERGVRAVAVFGAQSDEQILDIAGACGAECVQVYRDLGAGTLAALRAEGREIWRVYSVSDALPPLSAAFDMALFDTKGARLGGNGVAFDWQILRSLPSDFAGRFGIAGGLNAGNIARAAAFAPALLDINSGVEGANFAKDAGKIREILAILNEN